MGTSALSLSYRLLGWQNGLQQACFVLDMALIPPASKTQLLHHVFLRQGHMSGPSSLPQMGETALAWSHNFCLWLSPSIHLLPQASLISSVSHHDPRVLPAPSPVGHSKGAQAVTEAWCSACRWPPTWVSGSESCFYGISGVMIYFPSVTSLQTHLQVWFIQLLLQCVVQSTLISHILHMMSRF
jgi:hypothetical protein